MVTYSTSVVTKYSKTMSLVNHNRTVVFMLEFYYLWQFSKITFHREYTINNDQLYGFVWKFFENVLKVFHIVVLIFQLLCKRKTTTVNDRSVVTIITDNVIFTTAYHGNYTSIYRESRREAERLILVYKLCKVFLQFDMYVKSAIKETTAGATCAILVDSFLCCLTDT